MPITSLKIQQLQPYKASFWGCRSENHQTLFFKDNKKFGIIKKDLKI